MNCTEKQFAMRNSKTGAANVRFELEDDLINSLIEGKVNYLFSASEIAELKELESQILKIKNRVTKEMAASAAHASDCKMQSFVKGVRNTMMGGCFGMALAAYAIGMKPVTRANSFLSAGAMIAGSLGGLAHLYCQEPLENFRYKITEHQVETDDMRDDIIYSYRKKIACASIKTLYSESKNEGSYLSTIPLDVVHTINALLVKTMREIPERDCEPLWCKLLQKVQAKSVLQPTNYTQFLEKALVADWAHLSGVDLDTMASCLQQQAA